jgi:hypothetical protein
MLHSTAARLRPLLGVLVTLMVLSCQNSPAPDEDSQPVAPPEASAPFDVSAVMRQVHFAFRPDGAAWSGGHSTYGVTAEAGGLTLTPFASGGVKGAPLSVGAMRWQRGGQGAAPKAASARLERTGHLSLEREGFVEHVSNTEEGVRQEWTFSEAPSGSGVLVLSVPVAGLTYTGATAQGLHFVDERTGLGFRYGHAEWVDASGQRTPLQARYVADSVQYQVPASVLASTTYPATTAPVITPEFGMDQPLPAPQPSTQEEPVVASNGSGHFVVWKDFRQGTFQLFGARVSKLSEIQDVYGIILGDLGTPSSHAVAANGTGYLVVWNGKDENRVVARRVSAAGELTDTAPFRVLPQSTVTQGKVAVASNGTNWLVTVRVSNFPGQRVLGARVSAAGAALDPTGFAIATLTENVTFNGLAVASRGSDFFVAWNDTLAGGSGKVFGARVTGAGSVLDTPALSLATGASADHVPAVASNSSGYLVVWRDRNGAGDGNIFGARVTPSGTVVDNPGFDISTGGKQPSAPSIASDGENHFVVWSDTRFGVEALYGTRVSGLGAVVDGGEPVLDVGSGSHRAPVVAFNGTDYFVAWQVGGDVRGMRVTRTRQLPDGAGLVLTLSASSQTIPAVASNGSGYLVVWADNGYGASSIVGVRVSATGVVQDTSGLPIAWGNAGWSPAVASNGTDYLVVWSNLDATPAIRGTRVTAAGAVVNTSGVPLSRAGAASLRSPKLASNGSDYLITALQARTTGAGEVLVGIRVSGQGELLDASERTLFAVPDSTVFDPQVASNGKDYLVVWADARRNEGQDVYGLRVTSAGGVLDPTGIALGTGRYDQKRPAVASNGTDYLVVWEAFSSRNIPTIQGTRLTATGTVLDPTALVISKDRYQQFASVTSLGTEYLVTWQDSVVNSPDSNIHGARVTGGGIVREPQGIVLAASTDKEGTPAVVSAGDGRRALVVYDREDTAAPYWGHRIRGRLVTFSDNRPPMAASQTLTALEDEPLSLTLRGTDPDGQSLTYEIVTPPAHGTLSGTSSARVYQPAFRYSGPDRFTFRVSDGEWFSAVATVSIDVVDVNRPPSVPGLLAPGEGARLTDGRVTFQWSTSTDVDGDAITYELTVLPQGGGPIKYTTSQTVRTLVAGEALVSGAYTWQVRAVDSKGAESNASPVGSFTVTTGGGQDGGTGDGGVADGGSPDAGPSDGGTPGQPPEETSGCGCNPVPGSAPLAPLLLLALGLVARGARRRR